MASTRCHTVPPSLLHCQCVVDHFESLGEHKNRFSFRVLKCWKAEIVGFSKLMRIWYANIVIICLATHIIMQLQWFSVEISSRVMLLLSTVETSETTIIRFPSERFQFTRERKCSVKFSTINTLLRLWLLASRTQAHLMIVRCYSLFVHHCNESNLCITHYNECYWTSILNQL